MDTLTNLLQSAASTDLNITTMIVVLIFSILCGLIISLTYMKTSHSAYSQSFVITLAMLPVIMSVIIVFVGSNVARAFSLAGTLSIIRFRSAPGEPRDIGFIFFDIAAGLACGVGVYAYGLVFVIAMCIFLFILSKAHFGIPKSYDKILKITIPEDLDYDGAFDDLLSSYTERADLTKIRTTDLGSLFELVYHVHMVKDADEKKFIDELRTRNGNLSITLTHDKAPEF